MRTRLVRSLSNSRSLPSKTFSRSLSQSHHHLHQMLDSTPHGRRVLAIPHEIWAFLLLRMTPSFAFNAWVENKATDKKPFFLSTRKGAR